MAPTVDEKDIKASEQNSNEILFEKPNDGSTPSEPAPVYQQEPSTLDSNKDDSTKTDESHTGTAKSETSPALEEAQKRFTQQTICAFGPSTSFFFCYGGDGKPNWTYDYHECETPQSVSGNTVRDWQITLPYQVALSPHGAGYFAFQSQGRLSWHYVDISYSTRPKKKKLRKQFDIVIEAYAKLKDWLRDNVITADDLKSTKVVFGPAARYMAWKTNGVWISNDLPTGLITELRTRKETAKDNFLPRHATFGIGNSWAALWKDDSHTIELDGKFDELTQLLKERSKVSIDFIALDCCGRLEEYHVGFRLLDQRYYMTTQRRAIVRKAWNTVVVDWCSKYNTTFACTSMDGENHSRTIHDPKSVSEAKSSGANIAEKIKESERLVNQAALMSIKSSEKSIKASRIAIAGGVAAIAGGCTVM